MLENPHLETPLLVLVRSLPRALRGMRRNEWLPHGARFCTAGVAVDRAGAFYGWVVYSPEAVEIPSGVAHRSYLRFEVLIPAAAELDVLYHGPDMRRAYGSANAALRREAPGGVLDWELLDRVWRNVSGELAAQRYQATRRAFERRI